MKKLCFLAAAAGLTLIGASPHGSHSGPHPDDVATGYPPCSRTVTDRCIQLYERGVNTPSNLALNDSDRPIPVAQGGPYEPESSAVMSDSDYPPCSATVTDRCNQLTRKRGGHHRTAKAHHSRSYGHSGGHSVQMAGERG